MKLKDFLIAVGFILALAVIAIAISWITGGANKDGSTPVHPPQPPTLTQPNPSQDKSALPSYPAPDIAKFERVLNGSDKAAQAAVLLPEFRDSKWSPDDIVPQGAKLVLDQQSFRANGTVGQIAGRNVTTNGVAGDNYVIWLQHRDGQWLIWNFEKV